MFMPNRWPKIIILGTGHNFLFSEKDHGLTMAKNRPKIDFGFEHII